MTRTRKVDLEQAEREYIYDQGHPPVSFTDLAKRYGVSRNAIAIPGTKGNWYEKRKAFRTTLGLKVTEAMGEEFIQLEAAFRERVITIGLKYLAQYELQLVDEKITISTRDMLGVAAMLRTLTQDAAASIPVSGGDMVVSPEDMDLNPDDYRRALDTIRQLEAGGGDDSVDAPDPEEASSEGARQN